MSIITNSGKSVFKKIIEDFDSFKKNYCPDGKTCEDIISASGLVFVFWFMYLAIQPIV